MFSMLADSTEVMKEMDKKIFGMRGVLLGFIRSNLSEVNNIARQTVFNGSGKDTLGVVSGETQEQAFKNVTKVKFRNTASTVTALYWARITNLYQNYKDISRRKNILGRLAKEIKASNKVENTYQEALTKFQGIK